jgi:hypothetical protein
MIYGKGGPEMKYSICAILPVLVLLVCSVKSANKGQGILFKDDIAFLKQHTKVVVLSGKNKQAQIAVNPDIQGRIMTSTAAGPEGLSFGWINRELIASGQNNLHINAFGGEDRFWLGPEGGQFSIFFKSGAAFDLDHWYTPPPFNEGAFEIVSQEEGLIHFRRAMHLLNYSGTAFELEVNRLVSLLDEKQISAMGIPIPEGVKMVAFRSDNKITNTGTKPWTRESGLLSLWILGMFNPSPATTIIIPFKEGPEAELGPVVNDAYFGKVPADRLVLRKGVLFFKGDGLCRSKIGISPKRVKPFLGSYDAANGVLTIVHLTIPEKAGEYVNSMWQIQENPFSGDVVNSYNDGPASPGARPLGPFYELETSSPAAALKPGETLGHVHTTVHLQGDEKILSVIARQVLGVEIREIK